MSRNFALAAVLIVGAVVLWRLADGSGPEHYSGEAGGSDSATFVPPPPPSAAGRSAPVEVHEPEPEPPAEQIAEPAKQDDQETEQNQGDQGSVARDKALFETEPRDYAAGAAESTLRDAFADLQSRSDLFKSVSCRQTICRMELRWTLDRGRDYAAALAKLDKEFHMPLALAPIGPPDSRGVSLVEVYMKRRPTN